MPPAPVAFEAAGAGGAGSPARLEHAYLQLHEPSLDGSLSKPGPKLDRIDFQFNPKELSLSKRAVWKESPATGNKKAGPPQYTGPQPTSLTLEMFFDASDTLDSSVVKKVERLFSCCVPTSASFGQKKASPPWVLFRWGALTGFLAYIESVTATYTLFTSAGLPVRATCAVTLNEIAGEQPGQNPTSGGLVPRREHVLRAGDTLAGIAYAEYGDPSLWRAVAELNGVDDPVRLRPGRRLLLPAADELPRAVLPGGERAREVARAGD